ncbi:MAG: exonuclease domain-containing protein [Clostridia bacterium]|nr:exonuclease domain-containing protein [Clostridia bacterium]
MNYIVLDLEWNQPRFAEETVRKPVHLVGEIVQIGAVRMNSRFSMKKELRLTVCPKYYRKMHRKVQRITGLDNAAVQKGISFPEAVRKLKKFCGKDFVFLTWGPDDIPMLQDNLTLFSLDEDWIPAFYDLQVLFSHQKLGELRQMALEDAIALLGEKPFQAHDALCDAKSTALICRHLDMAGGLRDYPRLAGDITARPAEKKELSVRFSTRGEALQELGGTPFSCPFCDGYLIPDELIPQNANKYLSVATCTGGERALVRFRLFRSSRDRIGVAREIFPMDEILADFYESKRLHYEEQKKSARKKEKLKRARRKARLRSEATEASAGREEEVEEAVL